MTFSILIADTYPMMAESELTILNRLPSLKIVGICLQYEHLFQTLQSIQCPDAILLDPQLGAFGGTELCKKIKQLRPNCKMVVFGTEEDPVLVKKYFQIGIHGYLSRSATGQDLLQALQTVLNGATFIDKRIEQSLAKFTLGVLPRKRTCMKLTKREAQILQLIVEEYTTKEIAQELYIELCTVETHRQNIIQKLGVRNTAGLVRVALQSQLYRPNLP